MDIKFHTRWGLKYSTNPNQSWLVYPFKVVGRFLQDIHWRRLNKLTINTLVRSFRKGRNSQYAWAFIKTLWFVWNKAHPRREQVDIAKFLHQLLPNTVCMKKRCMEGSECERRKKPDPSDSCTRTFAPRSEIIRGDGDTSRFGGTTWNKLESRKWSDSIRSNRWDLNVHVHTSRKKVWTCHLM